MRHAPFIFTLLLLCSIPAHARANGVYIPEAAYPILPTIPVQRAIIVHKNGIETLIVESAFQTDSKNVAWILPLPAVPTKLDLADPGTITSACMSMRPRITHDLDYLWKIPLVLIAIVAPFAWVKIKSTDRKSRYLGYLKCFIVDLLLLLLLAAILLPSLATAGGSGSLPAISGIEIQSAQRLGDYESITLTAKSPANLSEWLTAQSLKPLDAAAEPIVADYISRGWCFVVTKLHRDAAGSSIPRPLVATFPAAAPVFPMKLTALANTTTHVELCIIADQQAAATHFHCQSADAFLPAERDDFSFSWFYYSPAADIRIGSPDVVPLLWKNCVVTQLVADLKPARMSSDIDLAFQPLAPHRDRFFSEVARGQIIVTILFTIPLFAIIIAMILYRGRRKPTAIERRFMIETVVVMLLIALATWFFLPTIPVHTNRSAYTSVQNSVLRNAIAHHDMPAADHSVQPDLSPAGLAALPQALLAEGNSRKFFTNPFTGELTRHERSPGNFDIRTIDGQLQLCTYSIDGIEEHNPIELPAATSQPNP